jgi:hypothetical protein
VINRMVSGAGVYRVARSLTLLWMKKMLELETSLSLGQSLLYTTRKRVRMTIER